MPFPLEPTGDLTPEGRNFRMLAALAPDFGNQSVSMRVGSVVVTWAGASPATSTTITHGLGRTPVGVWLSGNSNAPYAVMHAGSIGATTFNLFVRDVDNNTPANGTQKAIYWLVIG
jgi:hypothetical protein